MALAHRLVAEGQPLVALKVGSGGRWPGVWKRARHPRGAAASLPPPPPAAYLCLPQVVADVLRAAGLEREANESVAK